MTQCTTLNPGDRERILLDILKELDVLYQASMLDVYEQTWQNVEKIIQHLFPGFTLAYAEIYNAGTTRDQMHHMGHCLVPAERSVTR